MQEQKAATTKNTYTCINSAQVACSYGYPRNPSNSNAERFKARK
jgi:hypothetical protein